MKKKAIFRNHFSLLALLGVFVIQACNTDSSLPKNEEALLYEDASAYFESIGEPLVDVEKYKSRIKLGRMLYFEKRLSINNTISCNSCHALDRFGVDNEATSPGHDGTRGDRNSPTVYNAALHFTQFWDGRAADVEEQAIGPILNPIEHGLSSEKEALAKIDTPEYRALFAEAFQENKSSFSYKNIGKAIGAFERTLITESRFDDYLKGNQRALTLQEKRGLQKFISVGCISCHAGPALGGNSFQVLGAINPYKTKDLGRFNVTKNEAEKYMFKVPGLRNISKTYPYFHDGSVKDLKEAIRLMAYHQLDLQLEDSDVDEIEAFLGSLDAKELPHFPETAL